MHMLFFKALMDFVVEIFSIDFYQWFGVLAIDAALVGFALSLFMWGDTDG